MNKSPRVYKESAPRVYKAKASKNNSLQFESENIDSTIRRNADVQTEKSCEENVPCFVIEEVSKGYNVDETCFQDNWPESRGIYDMKYFMSALQRFYKDHKKGVECSFENIKMIKAVCIGLRTLLTFKCEMCHASENIWSESEDKKNNMLDIDTAATAETITAGIGYSQLEELLAAMNIPCMSEKTYINHREKLVNEFEAASLAETKKAAEAENQFALERNETVHGIPYITVIVDGSWMKRSYGSVYNSLSGIGAIIGYRTQKVLYVGIRNKYCTVCDMAERRGIEPKSHTCYRNFDRNACSASMESDAIVEGFKCSINLHGLIYKTVIADGDSSVYKSILDTCPYKEHGVIVKKVECINHLLRNMSKKLKTISETTLPSRQRNTSFVKYRNIVKNNLKNIRDNVSEAAAARRAEKTRPLHELAEELQKDILNIPSHIFGEHKRCKERGRTCVDDEKKENHVPCLQMHSLYQKIEQVMINLSCHSESLILNHTNNPAEWFNSIICKVIAGKRINFGARGSYNARIAAAILQSNTQQALTQLHEGMSKNVSRTVEKLEKRRQLHIVRKRKSRQLEGRQKKVKQDVGTESHYGPQSQKPDFAPEIFEILKKNHMDRLSENGRNWREIERNTRGQSDCDLWHIVRKEMLTASHFGDVCRMRETTSCAMIVKNILFPSYIDKPAMKYGRENEETVRKELATNINKEIQTCGLFIDSENPYLGASPDGLVGRGWFSRNKMSSFCRRYNSGRGYTDTSKPKSNF